MMNDLWSAVRVVAHDKEAVLSILDAMLQTEDGGPGSGNFGHKGRPGQVGGSGEGGGKGEFPHANPKMTAETRQLAQNVRQFLKPSKDMEDFSRRAFAAKKQRPANDKWRVTPHTAQEYKDENAKCFVAKGGSTFAVTQNGDIVSVCATPADKADGITGKSLMAMAVANGGKTLDSYDGNIGFYMKCGFEPISACRFNPNYADGWQESKQGRQDIVFMAYTGRSMEQMEKDYGPRGANYHLKIHTYSGDNGYDDALAARADFLENGSPERTKYQEKIAEQRKQAESMDDDDLALKMFEDNLMGYEEAQDAMNDGTIHEKVDRLYDILNQNGDYTPTKPTTTENRRDRNNDVNSGKYPNHYAAKVGFVTQTTGLDKKEAEPVAKALEKWTSNSWNQMTDEQRANVDKFIENDHVYDGQLYRGIKFETAQQRERFLQGCIPGCVFGSDNGLPQSWSASSDVAHRFAGDPDTGVIIHCVKNRTSSPIEYISNHTGENEVVSHSKASWSCLSTEVRGGRVYVNVVQRGEYDG